MHIIAARSLNEPCRVDLVSYCPTMDLIATVTPTRQAESQKIKEVVDVWRLNGQRVFGATFESQDEDGIEADGAADRGSLADNRDQWKSAGFVRALSWRTDGQILTVVCADGTISLINTFTGKIAHRFNALRSLQQLPTPTMSFSASQSPPQARARGSSSSGSKSSSPPVRPATVSSVKWTKHFAFPQGDKIRSQLDQSDEPVSVDELLGLKADMENILKISAHLPAALAAIDVEDSLPKVATLPPLGAAVDEDVFSSRASIDAIFHADGSGSGGSSKVGDVNALLAGIEKANGSCAVDLKIFDSFELGAIEVEDLGLSSRVGTRRVVTFDSHPFLSTVFLVIEQSGHEDYSQTSLHLVSMDLSFIPQTGRNLPLVARKATRLGNLLRYIAQIQMQMASELKAAFELPARFLRNIDEALAEGDPDADFAYAAHHLAVTGECLPRLKEWLVDEVGERGLKRWEKAVGDCLDLIRRMTSENLMPALERCHVILDRLHGLAMYGPTSSKLGLDEQSVGKIIETANALTIFAEDLLLDVGNEIREFTAFMKWMKFEVEVEALEEYSERAEELRESWTGESDLITVLDYVSGAMKDTRLKKYIGTGFTEQDGAGSMAAIDEDTDAGFFANYTKRRSAGKPLPTLAQLIERMQNQSNVVFGQIAEHFRKSILVKRLFEYPPGCDGNNIDTRVIPEQSDVSLYHLVSLFRVHDERDTLRVVSTKMRLDGGKNPIQEDNDTVSMSIPGVEEILDAKIVDDRAFLVLATTAEDVRIYQMSITPGQEIEDWDIRQVFEKGRMHAGMKPARFVVNGREGRRAATVVDEAGMGYLLLDIDSESEVEEHSGEKTEMASS